MFGVVGGLLGGCLGLFGVVLGLFGGCWPSVGRLLAVRAVFEHLLLFLRRACAPAAHPFNSQSMEGPFGSFWVCWGVVWGLLGGCLGIVWGLFGGCLGFVGRLLIVRAVFEHFLLFCFARHACDMAYGVFFRLFLSTIYTIYTNY